MGFVMTKQNDVVEVDVEIDGEVAFSLKIGALPSSIGEQVQQLGLANIDLVKAQQAGNEVDLAICMKTATESINEMVKLLCRYGIRGHKGFIDAEGVDIPCNLEEEKGTGYTVLTDETLNIYLQNQAVLQIATSHVSQIRNIGLGKFIKSGFKTLAEAKGASNEAPLVGASAP